MVKKIFFVTVFFYSSFLVAQSPLEDWRSSSTAMIAESAGAGSLFINPAGTIKTGENQKLGLSIGLPILNSTELSFNRGVFNIPTKLGQEVDNMMLAVETAGKLTNPASSFDPTEVEAVEDVIEAIAQDEELITDILTGTDLVGVGGLLEGIDLSNPQAIEDALTPEVVEDLINDSDGGNDDIQTIIDNASAVNPDEMVASAVDGIAVNFNEAIKEADIRLYTSILDLTYVAGITDLLSFSVGVNGGAKIYVNANPLVARENQFNLNVQGMTINPTINLTMQAYSELGGKVAFGFNADSILKGLSIGISAEGHYFLGINQSDLVTLLDGDIDQFMANIIAPIQADIVMGTVNLFQNYTNMNVGMDVGLLYDFDNLGLDWLSVGLNVRDVVGFTYSLHPDLIDDPENFRYTLDFDTGVFFDFDLGTAQFYGGVDFLEMRSFITGVPSPTSSIEKDINHFRFLVGLNFFDGLLESKLQYFNGTFTPHISFFDGLFGVALHTNLSTNIGAEIFSKFKF